jgi:hypothetical protein
MQLRQDIIRTLHQRRLESGREVRELASKRVRGKVVGRGAHDELGGVPWVIVRDREGVEHYARLGSGQSSPQLGRTVDMVLTGRGARVLEAGRGVERGG